jgi:hypothetical protein
VIVRAGSIGGQVVEYLIGQGIHPVSPHLTSEFLLETDLAPPPWP